MEVHGILQLKMSLTETSIRNPDVLHFINQRKYKPSGSEFVEQRETKLL